VICRDWSSDPSAK